MKNSLVMEQPPSPPPQEPVEVENPVAEPKDLLSLDDPNPVASNFDEKKASALSIVSLTDQPAMAAGSSLQNGTTGWELALVTAPSSYKSSTAAVKLKAGGLDKLTLAGLCDEAIWRSNLSPGYNLWETSLLTDPAMQQSTHNPFLASNAIGAPMAVWMAAMTNQHQAFMLQQHPTTTMAPQQQRSLNPFGDPSGVEPYGPGMHFQSYNPNTSLI